MRLGSALMLGALSGVAACSSTSTESSGYPQYAAPSSELTGSGGSAGSGGQLSTVVSGGSAGAATAGGTGAGGTGAGGFIGQCAVACVPQAEIATDLPAVLGAARQGTLTVCLDDQCYSSDLAKIPDSGGVSIGPPCYVSVERESNRATLQMFWTLEALASDGFKNGDRYRITVEQATTSAPVSVFDQMIDYTSVDYCNTGVCLEASIDVRGSIGSGGEGGAE